MSIGLRNKIQRTLQRIFHFHEHKTPVPCAIFQRALCFCVEHLADTINVVANGCSLLLLIIQQVNGIKEFQIVYLAKDGEQQVVVNVVADDSQVDIRPCTVVSL